MLQHLTGQCGTGPGSPLLQRSPCPLGGQTVTIRGVVVKFNVGVMGKNWIHLQDGSGDAAQGTSDITVTTLDGAAKGETIVIKGIVRTNKDFGAGYAYPVIVEEARIAKQ